MANLFLDAEEGISGSPVSGAQYTSVGTGVVYDDSHVAHGGLGYRFDAVDGTNAPVIVDFADASKVELTGYCFFTAAPTNDVNFFRLSTRVGGSGDNSTLNVGLSAAGRLNFITAAGTPQIPFQSTNPVPINTLLRIGVFVDFDLGTVRGAIYEGDSAVPIFDSGLYGVDGMAVEGSTFYRLRFMKVGGGSYVGGIFIDSLRLKTGADATNTFQAESPETEPDVKTTFVPVFDHQSFRAAVLLGQEPIALRLAVSTSSGMTNPSYFTGTFDPSTLYGNAKATGLQPSTKYYYAWELDGVLDSTVGSCFTVASPGSQASFQFGAASCQVTASNHPSLQHVAESNYRFFCHMGDLHYRDATTPELLRTGFEQSMLTERMKMFTQSTTMQYSWDNHDRIIIDGLSTGETDVVNQMAFWRQFVGSDMPSDANYKTWVDGRVRFIHTDPWTQRNSESEPEPRTMFGATQVQWIKDTLESATEPVIIWFKSFPNHSTSNGRWDSFPSEVAMWDQWIQARPTIKNRLIMVGGDSHDLRADSGTRVSGSTGIQHFQGIPDLNVSGLDQGSDQEPWDPENWDLGCQPTGTGNGAYSRFTVTDNGDSVDVFWEALHFLPDGTQTVISDHTFSFGVSSEIDLPGTRVTVWDGWQEVTGWLTLWDGEAEVEPASVSVMPRGYRFHSQMLSERPFKIAESGGSLNWPECSLRAYTQSVAWGMPALELSLNVTSDGVMFGLRDSTLDRTSDSASGGVDPQTLTWDVLQNNFTIDQFGYSDPYMKAEEVLELYSQTHLFFIDPRTLTSTTLLNNVFSMLKNFPTWDRMVIKHSGLDTTVADRARVAGFKTWGLWSDTPGDLSSMEASYEHWDFLGMEYSAQQSTWDVVASYELPVIGYTVASSSEYSQVTSKGADSVSLGVMVSDVKAILESPKVYETIEAPPIYENPQAVLPFTLPVTLRS